MSTTSETDQIVSTLFNSDEPIAEPPSDRRAAERHAVLIPAKISYDEGRSTLNCVIRDVSTSGAKLGVSGKIPLPGEFSLSIPGKNASRLVRLRWRAKDLAGVSFVALAAASG